MAVLAINGGKKAVTKKPKTSGLFQQMMEEQVSLIVELVRKREISFSPVVKELEEKFAAYIGTKYALTTNNGTSTLHSAFFSVIKNPGDEVITSVHTWHLGVTPIICAGGVPVFCDIEPLTLNIDPKKIEEKISPRTVAICVTHVYGHPCDMDAINSIAKRHNLAVIEDASHSHGCEYKGKKTGSLGNIGCFSLQGSKLMTGGEAGIIVTDNKDYYESWIMLGHYERMETLSAKYNKYKANQDIPFMNLGYKYRIHPFAAAMALVELKYLDERNQLQIKNCSYISSVLEKIEGFKGAYVAPYVTKLGWLNFLIRFDPEYFKGIPRTKIIEALNAEGVEAATGRPGYIPLVRQPLLNERENSPAEVIWYHFLKNHPEYRIEQYPVAEKVLFERIAIPSMRDIEYDEEYLQQILDAFSKISKYKDELN
ncbi:MAG TPA: DegT/DnrJ/EryC1/StrS family aminotransferase [bacterium]|nr:DegT/DnrJ/EryC1/StrS family aminotransferase [bacterium]HOL34991.1 DegT/DnrJ/EryC1/StrS family aminotransferase [bacterium]HPP08383.1 DegT/DnrJ/EryC1/StrS family aminotransferase [bacterium]